MRLVALFAICLLISGCHSRLSEVKQQTWADKPDGTKESFEYTPYDCVFVEPGVYYVESPSGIKVYFSCPPTYKVVGIKRVPVNPFTGEEFNDVVQE